MRDKILNVYADAAVYARRTGLGAVIKDARGNVIAWRKHAIGAMSNNEAEYEAVIFALQQVRGLEPREVRVFSDSRLVVEQLRGWIRVKNEALRAKHKRALELAAEFERVVFYHIPRAQNQLADAMADDAVRVGGKVTGGGGRGTG